MSKVNSSKTIKAVIFDFDGTIADSFEMFIKSAQVVLKHTADFTSDDLENLRNSSLKEVLKHLRVQKWQIPLIAIKGRREMAKHMDAVELFPGMKQALQDLHTAGYQLFVLSSNAEISIVNFLQKYELSDYFDGVYSDVGLFGKVKTLKQLMRQHRFKPHECVYVGDETRDIEAATKAQLACIAVAWGFTSPAQLSKHQPTVLLTQPQELATTVHTLTR